MDGRQNEEKVENRKGEKVRTEERKNRGKAQTGPIESQRMF